MTDNLDDLLRRSDQEDPDLRARLDAEWVTLVALRDTMGIGLKGSRNKNATYKQALLFGRTLLPELFDPEKSLLNQQKLSPKAQLYTQKAESSSKLREETISPIDLIKDDINEYEELISTGDIFQSKDLLMKELKELRQALNELQERKNTENMLIFRDAIRVKRDFPVSGDGRNYREFKISDERARRIRVLHPDKPEHATGADLIYENYWDIGNTILVRFAAIQYKLWKNKSLYIDERMEKQLGHLKATFCDKDNCKEDNEGRRKGAYHLPYCSAFLRPSEELQSENAQLLSTGWYTPICVANRLQESTLQGNKVLHSKTIRSEPLSHKIFEEMFNINMLGSRWLKCNELEDLYRSCNILDADENIVLHVQEIPF